jgi:hypothetical protein
MLRLGPTLAPALALVLAACAKQNTGHAEDPRAAGAGEARSSGDAPPAPAGIAGPLPTTPVEPPATPGEAPPEEPQLKPVVASGPPLPEVSVKTYGLHLGGGRDEDRQPILLTLEHSFPRFLACYPLVEDGGKEGTFGVDLVVPLEGGRPQVAQPRTAIRGDAFKACMLKVFETLKFKPQRRATAVSYSLKFNVGRD